MKRKHSAGDLEAAEYPKRQIKLFSSCDDLPGPSKGPLLLTQTASSLPASPPSSSATAHKTTLNDRESASSSKLDTLLGKLIPSFSTNQFLANLELSPISEGHQEQATPDDSAQLEVETRKRKYRKAVPRKRSAPSTSQVSSAESPRIKKAKRSNSKCGAKKRASSAKYRSRMSLIDQYRKKHNVSSRQSYDSMIAKWKKQLSAWRKKNRAIDSKDAHTMKYPSHLHEWMERVKFSHKPKWQMYKYEEPKWTKWQLSQTKTPQCSSTI